MQAAGDLGRGVRESYSGIGGPDRDVGGPKGIGKAKR